MLTKQVVAAAAAAAAVTDKVPDRQCTFRARCETGPTLFPSVSTTRGQGIIRVVVVCNIPTHRDAYGPMDLHMPHLYHVGTLHDYTKPIQCQQRLAPFL